MGIMKIVVNILLFLTVHYGTEGHISLTSDHEVPNHACPRDRVVYTCSTSNGVLSWDIGRTIFRYVNSSNNVNDDITKPELPGVRTVLTAKDGSVLISTLTISDVGAIVTNESTISCKDYDGNVNTSVLRIIGSPSAPGISVTLRDFASGSVNVQLTPPVYGRECVSEYIVEYDKSYRMIGTRTSTVISNLDFCFQGHNFSAFGVTPEVPNGTRSISVNFGHVPNPVNISVDSSQDLCPNRNPNTVTLTWNQPTRFRECISRYTLETTTARGSQTTSVTSNTTSVSVGCCLRYNFTVTPSYTTRSPTGQGTTRNIPRSFVSGQSNYPDPGNLQLTVMYGNTIALTVHWQNANALREFQNYMIVTCVNNNPHEKVIQRGTLTAPTNAKFLGLDYMTYIDRPVPVSVTFSRDDCTGSSSRSVTFPSIISRQPTVELDGENATFTVTFAMIPSVTFNVVSTAIVEINITARREDADLIRETTAFPPDFPRVITTQILITNLTQGTEYRYTVRVLTTSNYFTAVVIPSVVTGTFPMTTQADIGRAIGISVSPVLAVLLVIIVMVMVFLLWKKVSNRRQPRRPNPTHAHNICTHTSDSSCQNK